MNESKKKDRYEDAKKFFPDKDIPGRDLAF